MASFRNFWVRLSAEKKTSKAINNNVRKEVIRERKKMVLFFLLFGYVFFFTIVGLQPKEYSPTSIIYFLCLVTIIQAAQILISYLLDRLLYFLLAKSPLHNSVMAVILTGFVIANSYYFSLTLIAMPLVARVVLEILFGVAFYCAVSYRQIQRPVVIFSGSLLAISISTYAWAYSPYLFHGKSHKLFPEYETFLSHEIADKRNVYLLFVESLVGEQSLRLFFNVSDAPLYRFLRSSGFRVFDGVAAGPDTLRSYVRMLANSDKHGDVREVIRNVVSGFGFVPSYRIFMANGYQVQALFPHLYLGHDAGIFDFAVPKPSVFPPECMNVSKAYLYLGCSQKLAKWLDKHWYSSNPKDYLTVLKERVGVAAKSSKPWLTVSHLASLDHTSDQHNWNNIKVRNRFVGWYLHKLGDVEEDLRNTINEIRQNDPSGVIVIAGDHGARVTIPLKKDEHPDWYRDWYGVGVAVSPADFCTNKLIDGMTTYHIFRYIVACLSNGEDAFEILEEESFLPNDVLNAIKAIRES